MKQLLKRMSSILLSICMIITMLPTVAFATEDGVTGDTPVGLSTTYTISGTVRQNGSNNLLDGVSVQLINSSDETVGNAVTTNSSGVYIISDVAPGNYWLVLEKAGYIKATVGTLAVSNADITDADTTLVPIYTVSGTVSEINGSGLADASVQLINSSDEKVGSAVTTNSSGDYTISDVQSGSYTIEVSKSGYITGTISSVEVSNANVTDKNIALTTGDSTTYTISGQIFYNNIGVAGAAVQLKNSSGETVGSAVITDSDGNYTISDVMSGTYTLEYSKAGYATNTTPEFEITNANLPNFYLSLSAVYTVSGKVSDAHGGVKDASVQLKNAATQADMGDPVLTDENGDYIISEVKENLEYAIVVSKAGYEIGYTDIFEMNSGNVTGKDITLQSASAVITITTQPQNISVQQGGTATFTLVAENAVSYQWYTTADLNGIPHSNGVIEDTSNKVSGATTNTLTISDVTNQMNGATLWCTVSGSIQSSNVLSNQVTLTVTASTSDTLTGTATISGTPKFAETLTANLENGNSSNLYYMWKANGTVISGADNSTYKLTVNEIRKAITVEISATDKTGTKISSATATVEKADGATAPNTPTLSSKTHNSIAVTTVNGQEYRLGNGNWQDSGIFNGLIANTAYSITTRIKETPTTNASAVSSALSVTTLTYNGGSTGGGSTGGGGGGSSSSDDNKPTVTPTTPTPTNPKPATEVTATVKPTVSNGTVNATVSKATVDNAIATAQAEAKKNGTQDNGIVVEIKVDTKNTTANNISTSLPKASVDALVKAGANELRVTSEIADIHLNLDTLKEIQKQVGSDVNVSAKKVDNKILPAEAQKLVGDRPVYDFSITGANSKKVTNFGEGKVSISIPYTLGANENAANLVAYYIDSTGKVKEMANSVYDPVTKTLSFVTDHFSKFAVGYKTENVRFTDITNHWAKDSIEFVAARGILSGIGNNKFSPNTSMTRGMFVTAVGRLAEVNTKTYTKSSFTDVKADAYYMAYVEWANKNGIVKGISSTTFAPDQSITREQMAVIMANYAKAIGFDLPKVRAENIFADNASISSYAKDAVKAMQMVGILSGKNSNKFDPQGIATRAEVSAVLKRFVELAIDSDTAQGWTMNDSGRWMYYENGKPVTGKKTIDDSTYTFDQYGVTVDVPKNRKYGTYTVQKGDSFWLIAYKQGCTMKELEMLNNKSRFSLIHPGDELIVPEK